MTVADSQKPSYTLAQVAERWGISLSSVLMLVYSGDLPAIDVATKPAKRSRYIVLAEDLAEFELKRRSPPPEPKPERRKRRIKIPGGVIEFFEEK